MADPNQVAHKLAVAQAEAQRQNSINPSSSAAQVKAAQIAYYQAVLASGQANGIHTGALAALKSLGVEPGGMNGDT